MANYIKGNEVANATSYTLHKKLTTDGEYDTNPLATQHSGGSIAFNLDDLIQGGFITSGTYTFAVRAHADGYLSSEYSNSSSEFTVTANPVFTINTWPYDVDAIITLSATGCTQNGNSIQAPAGTVISYTVEASGYVRKQNTHTMGETNQILTVMMDATDATSYTMRVTNNQSATITLYCSGFNVVNESDGSKTIAVTSGKSPTYQVNKVGYLAKGGQVTLKSSTGSVNYDVELQPNSLSSGTWTDVNLAAGVSSGEFTRVDDYFVTNAGKWTGPHTGWSHWVLPVTPGQKYWISTTAGQSACPWILYKAEPTYVEASSGYGSTNRISYDPNPGMTVGIETEVTIPAGCTHMIINGRFAKTASPAVKVQN